MSRSSFDELLAAAKTTESTEIDTSYLDHFRTTGKIPHEEPETELELGVDNAELIPDMEAPSDMDVDADSKSDAWGNEFEHDPDENADIETPVHEPENETGLDADALEPEPEKDDDRTGASGQTGGASGGGADAKPNGVVEAIEAVIPSMVAADEPGDQILGDQILGEKVTKAKKPGGKKTAEEKTREEHISA